jgi:hypothetical protein
MPNEGMMVMIAPMTPSASPTSAKRKLALAGLAIAGFGSCLALVFSGTSLTSDRLISGGFERALASYQPTAHRRAPSGLDGVVGSEDFWLHVPTESAASVVMAVSVGREISVTGPDGERRMTVTDMRDISQAATHIAPNRNPASTKGDVGARTLLVTCRDGADGIVRQIRIMFDDARALSTPAADMPTAKPVPTT